MPPMETTSQFDSAVIDALGGASHVALLCTITPQAVSQWRRSGIPAARRMYLRLLRPDAFGIEGQPAVAALSVKASDAA